MAAWFDDDAFWDAFRDALFNPDRWRDAAADVDNVLRLLGLAPGASVLDLGCGPGRHALELARRGYRVTGVDRTATYLEQGRDAAAAERLEIDWVQADMREFRRDSAFDAAINLFTSFGYFDDPADELRVLENVSASLKPGGRLVLDLMGKEVLARKFQPVAWSRLADGRLWLEERAIKDDWSAVESLWMLVDGTGRFERRVKVRLYSAAELRSSLLGAGFSRVVCFGSLAGIPYDQDASRLVVVGQRPG